MFDVGFGEMLLIALIALIVLGPERLPKLARWVGRFTGQARAYMAGLSAELERESHLAELKRQLADTERLAREHADSINRAVMNTASPEALPAPVMTALPAPTPPESGLIAVPDEAGGLGAGTVEPMPLPAPVSLDKDAGPGSTGSSPGAAP